MCMELVSFLLFFIYFSMIFGAFPGVIFRTFFKMEPFCVRSRKGTHTFGTYTFFILLGVKHTFSPKNIKKLKCSRNGPPCVQNGLLPYQNAYFFATKLMVTSVSVKKAIFDKFCFLYFFTFLALKSVCVCSFVGP